jgi:hypothetical protein
MKSGCILLVLVAYVYHDALFRNRKVRIFRPFLHIFKNHFSNKIFSYSGRNEHQ